VLSLEGTEATVSSEMDPDTYRHLCDLKSEGIDFHGHAREMDGFAIGPFAAIIAGRNVISVFRYSPRHAQALEILKKGCPRSGWGDREAGGFDHRELPCRRHPLPTLLV